MFWHLFSACDSNPIHRCEQENEPAECLQRAVLEIGDVDKASSMCSK